MFYIYLSALIFGGSFLLMSLLLGDNDADTSDHPALDTDHGYLDHDLDIDHDLDPHTDDIHSPTKIDLASNITEDIQQLSHTDTSEAVSFISFRNITFFSAFFGLTGLVLDILSIPFLIAFLSSVGMGAFSWFFGYKLMKYLKSSESGGGFDLSDLKGKTALVTLPVSKDNRGKILVRNETSSFELIAKVSEVASQDIFHSGEVVLIIEIANNTAFIVENDYS
jgi:membrane protein implicated in regulation of membrane protease activity